MLQFIERKDAYGSVVSMGYYDPATKRMVARADWKDNAGAYYIHRPHESGIWEKDESKAREILETLV